MLHPMFSLLCLQPDPKEEIIEKLPQTSMRKDVKKPVFNKERMKMFRAFMTCQVRILLMTRTFYTDPEKLNMRIDNRTPSIVHYDVPANEQEYMLRLGAALTTFTSRMFAAWHTCIASNTCTVRFRRASVPHATIWCRIRCR
jgi:hypothetical protein